LVAGAAGSATSAAGTASAAGVACAATVPSSLSVAAGASGLGPDAGRRSVADPRDQLADGHGRPRGHHHRERSGGLGLVGHRRLVGLYFGQLLALGDVATVLDQPGEDRPLLHGVRQARHQHVGHESLQVR
jgi:hypothetical protein